MHLILRAHHVEGPARWMWSLRTADEEAIAEKRVVLDAATVEFEGFQDFPRYLRQRTLPGARIVGEARLVRAFGGWLAENVFGDAICAALARSSPGTVEVRVPRDAFFLLDRPFELTSIGGRSLLDLGLQLVYALDDSSPAERSALVRDALRILAVFSLPPRTTVLALRRERKQLLDLARTLILQHNRAIDIKIIQYGATREQLADAVRDGWDILHVSGHGRRGELILETADGQPDPLSTGELVDILELTSSRLKLVVLNACHSGASTAAEAMSLLDLLDQAEAYDHLAAAEPDGGPVATGLARGLLESLNVAVLAMRYKVTDDFAAALTIELYSVLLRDRRPLDVAVGAAIVAAAGPTPTLSRPVVCRSTVALFGSAARGLTLGPPSGGDARAVDDQRMRWFPREPDRFVGRADTLIAANTALSHGGGHGGVIFVGMVGAGKTACALEASYHHAGRFAALAWWRAPEVDSDAATVFAGLAHAWLVQLGPDYAPPFSGVDAASEVFKHYLERLRWLLDTTAILVVLDNVETMLDEEGAWSDPRIGAIVQVFAFSTGRSRVVLTSRIMPRDLPASLLRCDIGTLTLAESVMLAQELPHLAGLLHFDTPASETSPKIREDRDLVRDVLHVVQGHPKLLELADAAGDEMPLAAFLSNGIGVLDDSHLLRLLLEWATRSLRNIPDASRVLICLLTAAEETDRHTGIIESAWALMPDQVRAGRQWPSLGEALAPLANANLIAIRPIREDADYTAVTLHGSDPMAEVDIFEVHPGIAQAVRQLADRPSDWDIQGHLADVCMTFAALAQRAQGSGAPNVAHLLSHYAMAAVPYLLRTHRWAEVGAYLHEVRKLDESPDTARRALAYLSRLETEDPDQMRQLGWAQMRASWMELFDPVAAADLQRAALAKARGQGLADTAITAASDLVNHLLAGGDLSAAERAIDELDRLLEETDADEWLRLSARTQRLQFLERRGDNLRALAEADTLLRELDRLTASTAKAITPWQLREIILSSAFAAAVYEGQWNRALAFNTTLRRVMRERGATRLEIASHAISAAAPLMALSRLEEAEAVLQASMTAFEAADASEQLDTAMANMAELEARRGEFGRATDWATGSLRYLYAASAPLQTLARAHNMLAACLRERDGDTPTMMHSMAAALLQGAAGQEMEYLGVLLPDARQIGRNLDLEFILNDLIEHTVERVDGVRFLETLRRHVPDPTDRANLVARMMAPGMPDLIVFQLRHRALHEKLAGVREWAPLVPSIRRLLSGASLQSVVKDLDPICTQIMKRVFEVVHPTGA
ncbi:MAG TPA: CHAT domain-containing protein [Candidatus Limnocylindrales bacterium]|nr:CHAT domain-containing protein [Candidatus Limnocylindrales bacterium]